MQSFARESVGLGQPAADGLRGLCSILKPAQKVIYDKPDTFIRSDAIATGLCPANRSPEIWPPAAIHITQQDDRFTVDRFPVARTVIDLTSQVHGYDRSAITAGSPESRCTEPSQTELKNEERDADQCIAIRRNPDCDPRRRTT